MGQNPSVDKNNETEMPSLKFAYQSRESLENLAEEIGSRAKRIRELVETMKAHKIEGLEVANEGYRQVSLVYIRKWLAAFDDAVTGQLEKIGHFKGTRPVTDAAKPVTGSPKRKPTRKDLRSKTVE